MNTLNAVKQYGVVLLMLLCLLLCGCQVLFPAEHTELVVDGEYKPFNVPRMTMEKLMELVEAEDVDYIYEVFSPAVREYTEGLQEQIKEFIRFVEENVTAWDFSTGLGDVQRKDGVTTSTRISLFTFDTSSGTYQCDIDEVIKNTVQPNLVGFSGITVFPEELSWEYAPKEPSGIYIVYRVEDKPQNALTEPSSLEILLELAVKEDTDGIDQLFSVTAKRHSKELQEKLPELVDFLNTQVTSLEPYTWAQNVEEFNGDMATVQEMFFYLHTDHGLYRCDVRDVLESDYPVDTGLFSISIFPALYPGEEPEYEDTDYEEICTWGRENMGISIVYWQEDQAS